MIQEGLNSLSTTFETTPAGAQSVSSVDKPVPRPRFAYIGVNGIRTRYSPTNWHERFVYYVNQYTNDIATVYFYHTKALARKWGMGKWIEELRYKINAWTRTEDALIPIGHSNGCVVLPEMMVRYPMMRVKELHLVAAACHENCEKNKLNILAERNQFEKVFIYYSSNDEALKAAEYDDWLAWIGDKFGKEWGYGSLGRYGPDKANKALQDRMEVIDCSPYKHSTYWDDAHRMHTFWMLTHGGQVPTAEELTRYGLV